MSFLKKNAGNILFCLFLGLLIIPQTRMTIQVFVQRLISFGPSEVKRENRKTIEDYEWKLESLENGQVDFSASKGNVVIVNFWATWCPPCVAEMPSFQELYNVYGGKVDFYFVSSEKPQTLQKFLNKHSYSLPVYVQNQQAPAILLSNALPTTFLISKKGEIIINETGAADWNSEKVKRILDDLLAE